MTARFEAEKAERGRDWSESNLSDQAAAYLYEMIAPDETVVGSGLVSRSQRQEITQDFLSQDNKNVIVFYEVSQQDLDIIHSE